MKIILINDGSTDMSGIICEYLKTNYSNIKVVHTQNSGVSSARNKGIKESNGELLAFVDADDIIDFNYVQEIINFHSLYKCNIIQIGHRKIDNEKELYKVVPRIKIMYQDLSVYILNEKYSHAVWSYIFNRKFIIANNITFTEGLKYSEDQEFIFKALTLENRIGVLNRTLYTYHFRAFSAVNNM